MVASDTSDLRSRHPLVAHCILDADALEKEISGRYPLPGPIVVLLLYRGMNDIYVVHSGGQRYALRAWRGGWRSEKEVQRELAFLRFLKDRDFPASAPLAARDGSYYFSVEAPEATRFLAMYEWAPGRKFSEALDMAMARKIGGLFARLHLLAREFEYPSPHSLKGRACDPENLPYLDRLLSDRPDDITLYHKLARAMQAKFDTLEGSNLPSGQCHGDFHPSNVHVTDSGDITLLDFDGCGDDYLLQDIANYVFGNEFYGFDRGFAEAFLAGYREVRPLTALEESLFDFFVLAKTFRLITGLARNVNAVGQGSLRYRGLDWFSRTIRERACKADLI
jgi:Ser/Thr protein kinase RdoA (MazF antagonist)